MSREIMYRDALREAIDEEMAPGPDGVHHW